MTGEADRAGGRASQLMRQALTLAASASGRTRPNPPVGCIITRDDAILAQGFHARAGQAHAEIDALRKLNARAEGATLYVTLEPCCTHGRTPPCTEAILNAGLGRVVIGALDPNPRVNGAGVALLRAAGVEVIVGVERERCEALIAPFAKRVTTGLPWVSLKHAMSLDGKIAARSGESAWITGEAARERVHALRDVYDAVMVGKNTLLHDDPLLTCRRAGGRDPHRVVLDARLDAPLGAKVYDPGSSQAPTIVIIGPDAPPARVAALRERGVLIEQVEVDGRGRLAPEAMLRALAARGLMSVLVEGGGQLAGALWDARLVDRVYGFVAPRLIGGADAPGPLGGLGALGMSEAVTLERVSVEPIGADVLITGDVPQAQRRWPLPFG